jgi:hypothetical protein
MEPALIADELPFVSLIKEIEANSLNASAEEIRRQYGRIPYSSPLYWWETHTKDGVITCVYIGKTVHLRVQKRFEAHSVVMRLLAKYVNSSDVKVMFRLCSRLDILFDGHRYAIEHLPPDDAARIVTDVEAYLIYENQPLFNTQHKSHPKIPWKPFVVEDIQFR